MTSNEILASIFHVYRGDGWIKKLGLPFLIAAASVCHRWRQVVHNTPSLWTQVAYRSCCPPPLFHTIMERSKACLLDIMFRIDVFSDVGRDASEELELVAILPYLYRCQRLIIDSYSFPAAHRALQKLPLDVMIMRTRPIFRYLTLTILEDGSGAIILPKDVFFSKQAPALTRVVVHGMLIDPMTLPLYETSTLELRGVSGHRPLPHISFRETVMTPTLTHLVLHKVILAHSTVVEDTIYLPSLKSFRFTSPKETSIACRMIFGPNVEDVTLKAINKDDLHGFLATSQTPSRPLGYIATFARYVWNLPYL
jgi:hypothetical protein